MVDKPLYIQENGSLHAVNEQYPLVDGTRGFTGVVSGVTPTADAHLATKQYVDSGVINADTTLHISTTGNDSTGDGSSGSPWATIPRALEYLENKLIALDATVTIQLADGNHSYSSSIEISHPHGKRISIVGTTLIELSLTSVGTISGTAPDRTIVLNVDSTSGLSAGDLFKITGTAGVAGTWPKSIQGANKIISIDSATQMTVYFGQYSTTRAPSGAITGDITVFKTKISTSSDIELLTIGSGSCLGNLNNLALEGDSMGTGIRAGGFSHGHASVIGGDTMLVRGFTNGLMAAGRGIIYAPEICVGNCVQGIWAFDTGVVYGNDAVVNWCSLYGVRSENDGYIYIAGSIVIGCSSYGVYAEKGGKVRISDGFIGHNASAGAMANMGAQLIAQGCTVSYNENTGIYIYSGSFGNLEDVETRYNDGHGLVCAHQSMTRAPSILSEWNSGNGIYCGHCGYIFAPSSVSQNNTVAQYSPAKGTEGNTLAYIY